MKIAIPRRWLAVLLVPLFAVSASGTYLDDTGYTALSAQLAAAGIAVPDGAGVSVTQVEASVSTTSNLYLPTAASYSGVTITDKSSSYAGGISWHADMVGHDLYGDSSMGSGITAVGVYYVNAWLSTGSLNYSTNFLPATERADVQNHSWVGSLGSTAADSNVLNRLDYSIENNDYVAVVGVNNNDSGTSTAQNLLSGAYNVISVGVSDGTHTAGTSSINAGVASPHLVVPVSSTSEATAIVSSAATLLIETARSSTSTSANGDKSEVIKAILLAGATKSEFSNWTASESAPLDATYGAGELNVQNSYKIMSSGEQTASSSTPVSSVGWDYNTISLNQTVSYYCSLSGSGDLSIALNWNAVYSGSANSLSLSLANLNLSLYTVNADGSQGPLVQQSIASSGNVEALWAVDLNAGSYAINVTYAGNTSGSKTSASYALAWQTSSLSAIPEPSALLLILAGAILGLGAAVRRKSFTVAATPPRG